MTQTGKTSSTSAAPSAASAEIHFASLCNAVEHERLEKARSILRAANTPPNTVIDS